MFVKCKRFCYQKPRQTLRPKWNEGLGNPHFSKYYQADQLAPLLKCYVTRKHKPHLIFSHTPLLSSLHNLNLYLVAGVPSLFHYWIHLLTHPYHLVSSSCFKPFPSLQEVLRPSDKTFLYCRDMPHHNDQVQTPVHLISTCQESNYHSLYHLNAPKPPLLAYISK